jgi:hypothetical protein
MAPTLMTFLMAQANFEPTFSCINASTILKPSYYSSYTPAYEDGTECSETSAYKIQMPENYPEEKNIQHSQHGKNLKSRRLQDIEEGFTSLVEQTNKMGLQIHEKKTQFMRVSQKPYNENEHVKLGT